jgi:SHS2 domain-containing protein
MTASHKFLDHTGEVELTLEADTLPELFVEAGRALAELMMGRLPEGAMKPASGPAVAVELAAPDRTRLLVDWLNEIIFHTEIERTVFTDFAVEIPAEGTLTAELRGLSEPAAGGEVKAATLHEARIEPRPGGGFTAHVILDV